MKNRVLRDCQFCASRKFQQEISERSTHSDCPKGEVLQGWIWTQVRNSDTPSLAVFIETQDDAPSCLNTVHREDITESYHLLSFDGASDVVNEENKKFAATRISASGADDPEKG